MGLRRLQPKFRMGNHEIKVIPENPDLLQLKISGQPLNIVPLSGRQSKKEKFKQSWFETSSD